MNPPQFGLCNLIADSLFFRLSFKTVFPTTSSDYACMLQLQNDWLRAECSVMSLVRYKRCSLLPSCQIMQPYYHRGIFLSETRSRISISRDEAEVKVGTKRSREQRRPGTTSVNSCQTSAATTNALRLHVKGHMTKFKFFNMDENSPHLLED